MSLAMLLLMEYGLIGEKLHEWIGMAMFALFITHHILNRRWLCSITKGRYTLQRIVQTVTAVLILLCISGSMFSGIVISRYVFDFLKIRETLLAVKIHTIEGKNYEVAGVLSQMGTVSSGISPDSSIYVPYSTAEKYIFGNDTAPTITAVASDADKVETVMENINTLLTENYPQASFTLTDAGSGEQFRQHPPDTSYRSGGHSFHSRRHRNNERSFRNGEGAYKGDRHSESSRKQAKRNTAPVSA